jgi:hypothetical protein
MAHNIQMPLAFEFRPLRASWDSVVAEITGLALSKSPSDELQFSAKVHKGDTTYLLGIPWWALPEEVLRLYSEKSTVRPDVRGHSAELLVCSPVSVRSDKRPEADAWTMRKEFLHLKRNTKSLLAFLNKWGVWGTTPTVSGFPEPASVPPTGRVRRDLGPRTVDIDLDPNWLSNIFASGVDHQAYILPVGIWNFQQKCRKTLTSRTDNWLTDFQKLLPLTLRRRYPYFLLGTSNCREAIVHTITLDLLKNVQFRICARGDCGAPFPIENQHRREYCCQYCAHIESVRRQRRAARREAKHLSKGVTHAKRQGA